jgi:hypothetical protein
MATKRKDPLDAWLEENPLADMGFTEEAVEERFARPKQESRPLCKVCGTPVSKGAKWGVCRKPRCAYLRARQIADSRSRAAGVRIGLIEPKETDIVCKGVEIK